MSHPVVSTAATPSVASPQASQASPEQIVESALAFAREKIAEHHPEPGIFHGGLRGNLPGPVNEEISQLLTLMQTIFYPAFEGAIKQYQDHEDRWSKEDVLAAADGYMKIAFAISYLALEDLGPFCAKLEKEGVQRTKAQALSEQDTYLYRAFYACAGAYNYIRGGIGYGYQAFLAHEGPSLRWPYDLSGCTLPQEPAEDAGKEAWNAFYSTMSFALLPALQTRRPDVPNEHAAKFYEEGTPNFAWRTLFNAFCDAVDQQVTRDDLIAADMRLNHWSQKDTDPESFKRDPDTMPT